MVIGYRLIVALFLVAHINGQKQVGILYEGWHAYAADAMVSVANMGGEQLVVEDIIQSNGSLVLNDIFQKYGLTGAADNFLYQAAPLTNASTADYYCIYRADAQYQVPGVADCLYIESTLTTHAQKLINSGIDYIAFDCSNLATLSDEAIVIQLRPLQVLFEEWYKLRQQGQPTPSISVFATIPTGATLYQNYLDLYNNASYADLVMKDPATNKLVMFIVENPTLQPDAAILQAIQSNGGRNNIATVPMWAEFSPNLYQQGYWGFFSPCTVNNGQTYTTSVANAAQPCAQPITTKSPIGYSGTAVSASPSYQLSYGSLPFEAVGKMRGLPFKKQFQTVFSVQPDYVFISSYNEWLSQPQSNPYQGKVNTAFSMGLPDDPSRYELFVDTYGAEFSRDIEPSTTYGSYYLDLMASCIRVYKSGATSCSSSTEECCDMTSSDVFANIWVLETPNDSDCLLTNSANELNTLVGEGAYVQVCTPFSGPTDFCVNTGITNGQTGPFIIFSSPVTVGSYTAAAMYRCLITENGKHFFSMDPNCEGYKTEFVLGYISPIRVSEMPRMLYRCYNPSTGVHYPSLDLPCPAGQTDGSSYGFVH